MDGFGKNYYIEHRNDGRKYVRCRNRNLSGLKCSFCKRYDHFKNWFNANNTHVCHYSEIENNLDNLFQKEISKDISIEKIYKEIAVLIGRENLPLNFCSSNSLSSLIKLSILYGSKNHCKINDSNINQIYNSPSRKKIRNMLIESSHEIHRSVMNKFQTFPYVCISIDEGTTQHTKFLDINIENAHKKVRPYPAYIIEMKALNTDEYQRCINSALFNLKKYKIMIGSIIIDGSKAQINAIHQILENSKDNTFKKIIVIPCLCHRIQNAITMCVKKSKKINTFMSSIHILSKQCIKNANIIKAICPSHISTRWIYDYDIVKFIVDHRLIISQFANIPYGIDEMCDILKRLKSLTKTFEDPKIPIGNAYKLLQDTAKYFDFLHEQGNIYSKKIKMYFERYTIKSEEAGIWLTAYLFTPYGHNEYFYHCTKQDIYEEKIPFPATLDEKEEKYDSLSFILDQGINTIFKYASKDNNVIDDENISSSYNSNCSTIIEPALNFIRNYYTSIYDENIAKKSISLFHEYLNEYYDLFDIIEQKYYDWNIIKTDQKWMYLAELALRFQVTGCSEASCERTISAQRLIYTDRRLNSSQELLESRLQMIATK